MNDLRINPLPSFHLSEQPPQTLPRIRAHAPLPIHPGAAQQIHPAGPARKAAPLRLCTQILPPTLITPVLSAVTTVAPPVVLNSRIPRGNYLPVPLAAPMTARCAIIGSPAVFSTVVARPRFSRNAKLFSAVVALPLQVIIVLVPRNRFPNPLPADHLPARFATVFSKNSVGSLPNILKFLPTNVTNAFYSLH